jgi:hypothetical protein
MMLWRPEHMVRPDRWRAHISVSTFAYSESRSGTVNSISNELEERERSFSGAESDIGKDDGGYIHSTCAPEEGRQ